MPREIFVVKEEGHKQLANSSAKLFLQSVKSEKLNGSIKANEKNYEKNVDLFPFLKVLNGELMTLTSKDQQGTTPTLIADVVNQTANAVNPDIEIRDGNLTQEAQINKETHKKNGYPFEAGRNSENIILQVLLGTSSLLEKSPLVQKIMWFGNLQDGDNSLQKGDALLEGRTSVQNSMIIGQEVEGTNKVMKGNYIKKLFEASAEMDIPFSGALLDVFPQREDIAIMQMGEISGDNHISHNQIRLPNETTTIRLHNLPLDIEKYIETDPMATDGPQSMIKMIENVLMNEGYSDGEIVAILSDIDIKQLSLLKGESASAIVKKINEAVLAAIKNDRYGIKELPGEQVSSTDLPNKLSLADNASLLQKDDIAAEQREVDEYAVRGKYGSNTESFIGDAKERIWVRQEDIIAVHDHDFTLRLPNETTTIRLHNLPLDIEKYIETDPVATDRPQSMIKMIENVLINKGYSDGEIVAILADVDIKQLSLIKGESVSAIVKKINETVLAAIKNDRYGIQELPGEQVSSTDLPDKLSLADNASLLQRDDIAAEERGVDEYAARGKFGGNTESFIGDAKERIWVRQEDTITVHNRDFPSPRVEIQGLEKQLLKNGDEEANAPKLGAYFAIKDDKQNKNTGMLQNDPLVMDELFSSEGRGDFSFSTDALSIMKKQNIAFVQTESFVERIAELLPQVAHSGSGKLKIMVSPPNLGSIDMDIMVRENTVQVVMRAENRDVIQMLQGNVDQLKSALQQQGLQVDSFNVLLQSGRFGLPGESGGGNAFWHDVRQERGDRKGQTDGLSPSEQILSIRGKDVNESREGISIFV